MTDVPTAFDMPTSQAREKLSQIVLRVQHRDVVCFLTRHGRRVAVVVSMDDFRRIDRQELIARIGPDGVNPGQWWTTRDGRLLTNAEAAEYVQGIQYDRLRERNALAMAGLDPVPGGELEVEMREVVRPEEAPAEAPTDVPARRGWLGWFRGR